MSSSHPEREYHSPSSDALAETVRAVTLPAEPSSASVARRFVTAALSEWGRSEFCEEAAVCTAELATNAILHSREPFTVAVRCSVHGARLDVLDGRPHQLPLTVPEILDPLAMGTTGRGLMMVAALADRWGYFTTDVAKTVWVELAPGDLRNGPTVPEVEVADRPESALGIEVKLLGVPVRLALASGVQIDELVREAQLNQNQLSAADQAAFAVLLERSARPRLIGRQEAFKAAAEGRPHYDVALTATLSEMTGVAELASFLEGHAGQYRLAGSVVGDDVAWMRAWINSEIAAQRSGAAPTPYVGPAGS